MSVQSCAGGRVDARSVRAGDCLIAQAAGFSGDAVVVARLLSAPTRLSALRADRRGVVCYRWTVGPATIPTPDVLTLVQRGPERESPSGEGGNLTVAVPRFAVWRYSAVVRRP